LQYAFHPIARKDKQCSADASRESLSVSGGMDFPLQKKFPTTQQNFGYPRLLQVTLTPTMSANDFCWDGTTQVFLPG
jgi:hypothetical protein